MSEKSREAARAKSTVSPLDRYHHSRDESHHMSSQVTTVTTVTVISVTNSTVIITAVREKRIVKWSANKLLSNWQTWYKFPTFTFCVIPPIYIIVFCVHWAQSAFKIVVKNCGKKSLSLVLSISIKMFELSMIMLYQTLFRSSGSLGLRRIQYPEPTKKQFNHERGKIRSHCHQLQNSKNHSLGTVPMLAKWIHVLHLIWVW